VRVGADRAASAKSCTFHSERGLYNILQRSELSPVLFNVIKDIVNKANEMMDVRGGHSSMTRSIPKGMSPGSKEKDEEKQEEQTECQETYVV